MRGRRMSGIEGNRKLGTDNPAADERKAVVGLLDDERGQSTVASFPYIAILLLFLLGLAAFVAKVRPAQASVAAAARVCVRQAVESLDLNRALDQGATAAYAALEARHLDPAQAQVQVTPLGPWGRVARVECRVNYTVRLNVLFGGLFAPREKVLTSAYQLDVQRYKSLWGEE